MIIIHCIFTLLLIFEQAGVSRSENENVETLVRGRYSFNHPPIVEDYHPIPVDVIYDEEGVSDTKTIGNNDDDSKTDAAYVNRNGKALSVKPNNGTAIKVDKSKGRSLDVHQIPVAVVYEKDSERITNNYRSRVNSRNGTDYRGRIQRSQQSLFKGKEKETVVQKYDKISKIIETTTLKATVLADEEYEKLKKSHDKTSQNSRKRSRERDPIVPIIESENYVFSHRGDFRYSYEGGDGTKAFERGELKSYSDDATGEAVVGGFSYTDKEGNDFSLSYTADENGYRPVGAHLPTPPPIPPAIARALLYISTKTTPAPVTGRYLQ